MLAIKKHCIISVFEDLKACMNIIIDLVREINCLVNKFDKQMECVIRPEENEVEDPL